MPWVDAWTRPVRPSTVSEGLVSRRLLVIALCELFVLILQAYEYVVSPLWSYTHYTYVTPSTVLVVAPLFLTLVCAWVLPIAATRI